MFNESIGSYFRVTTNGTMRTYRSNLMKSRGRLNDAMEKVQTQRQFNSYAEDPAAASKAFQIRRSMWRTQDQISNIKTLVSINESAWSAVGAICDGDSDNPGLNGYVTTLRAINGADAGGRTALGQDLLAQADAILQNMNVSYAGKFVFAGSDGLNVPFSWDESGTKLLYRGVDVNAQVLEAPVKSEIEAGNPWYDDMGTEYNNYDAAQAAYEESDYYKLTQFTQETHYVDIGLGLKESDGELIASSAYDASLCGLDFVGYGRDQDGDPQNLILLVKKLGQIFSRCDQESGSYAVPQDEEDAVRLTQKLLDRINLVGKARVSLDEETRHLNNMKTQLEQTNDLLDEQREGIEGIDPADAITQMSWANYCYQAALKIGNQVLSQSLLDYMQ